MTKGLGSIGIFGGNSMTDTIVDSNRIVNEVMENRPDNKKLPKSVIRKRLDAFEIVSAVNGLTVEQQEAYSQLLKYC